MVGARMTAGEYQQLVEFLGAKFAAIDGRFDAVDRRFDAVDRRFDAVEGRSDAAEGRLTRLEVLFEEQGHRIELLA